MADHPLSQRITDVLDLQPSADAIEYDGRWHSWGQVGEAARQFGPRKGLHGDVDRRRGHLGNDRIQRIARATRPNNALEGGDALRALGLHRNRRARQRSDLGLH